MHANDVIHRDIKLENIVLCHVTALVFRVWQKSVISDGRCILHQSSDLLSVELPSIYLLRYCLGNTIIRRLTHGRSVH